MLVDLRGKTVTHAIQQWQHIHTLKPSGKVFFSTDSEVVKLNLLHRIQQSGLKCQLNRKHHTFTLEVDFGLPTEIQPETAPTPHPKVDSAKLEPLASSPAALPRSTPAREAPTEKADGPVLVLTKDQLGQRDFDLGQQLLVETLEAFRPAGLSAVILMHRAVRLLDDPNAPFQALLLTLSPSLNVCRRSLAYYGFSEPIDPKISTVEVREFISDIAPHRMIWL